MLLFAIVEIASVSFLPAPLVDRRPLVRTARHPTLNYALEADQRAYSYQAEVRTNRHGLRERELADDILRRSRVIVCLGGSETFGKGVGFEETYPQVLEAMLHRAETSTRTVVLNAGVPDFNIDQSVELFVERARDWSPAVAVLAVYWDDLYFVPGVGSSTTSNNVPTATTRQWGPRGWAQKLGILDRLAPIYTRSRVLMSLRNWAKETTGRLGGHAYVTWRDALLRGESLPALEVAWSRARRQLRRFAEVARSARIRAVVLILPMEHQMEAGSPRHFDARARREAERVGLEVIEAGPAMLKVPGPLFLPYDGRPNAAAHARIAEALAEAM